MDLPQSSSQFDIYHDSNGVSTNIPSSPPEIHSVPKPRKPPSITPRRFTRFFTPKSLRSQNGPSSRPSRSRQKLSDITTRALNLQPPHPSESHRQFDKAAAQDGDFASLGASPRKRKLPITPPDSSPLSSPSKRVCYSSPSPTDVHEDDEVSRRISFSDVESKDRPNLKPNVRRLVVSNNSGRILERSFGGPSSRNRSVDHRLAAVSEMGDYFSSPDDRLHFSGAEMPFCIAGSHSTSLSLVATGDEEGRVLVLNAADGGTFPQVQRSAEAHRNAIVDVEFSPDDRLIATASGDQTAKIYDAYKMTPIYHLRGPGSAIKKICFQPSSGEVIAASRRDGSICLYDVRVQSQQPVLESQKGMSDNFDTASLGVTACTSGQRGVLGGAAQSYWRLFEAGIGHGAAARRSLMDSAPETRRMSQRLKSVSVTALSFLGERRPDLILSGSESSMSMALWDIRMSSWSSRPVAMTAEPSWHRNRRQYAMTSIVVSEDTGRVYALGKDSTLYAYSTEHLILGTAPELDRGGLPRKCDRLGLGPLYGFRHPDLLVGSFYVKAALRRATASHAELVAVGNSSGKPILFPTDPSLIPTRDGSTYTTTSSPCLSNTSRRNNRSLRPTLQRASTGTDIAIGGETIPIFETGVALTGGHEKEVSDVAWTAQGNLVTASDDFSVRCWRRGAKAAYLRGAAEHGPERWASGWADVPETVDDEDEILE
ncbi:WD40 repeat-like protein [Eremomyces bilateralis CBS 781.70]|uniref:WD40 repeat-like protein n=1 Tax=Eremomyces bilateralis CBS 781.70 TaxID=1392243 RepID=A0A6G1GAR6_9PEZI|nr:WD40 repeat-like protein [Eremomyces bilateralis CBS 781.70]KAF1815187.1 WD40 repeat-like protein [Eremomyces bilateralis CBS 781.70]